MATQLAPGAGFVRGHSRPPPRPAPALQPAPEPAPEPTPEPWTYDRSKILWLELPDGISGTARLGVVNSTYGPLFVLRVKDETDGEIEREINGPPSDMLDLAYGIIGAVELMRGLQEGIADAGSLIAEARARRAG